jgi:Ca2+-binding RTX toxin-like protein
MSGVSGNDTYYVDNAGDRGIDTSEAGIDRVYASVTYTLGVGIEHLILTGSTVIDGTGSRLSNVLASNSGNNVLDGRSGADTMVGGLGNDTYHVDNAGDVVIGSTIVQLSRKKRSRRTSRIRQRIGNVLRRRWACRQ